MSTDPAPSTRAYDRRLDRGDGVPRPADVDDCTALGCRRTDDLRLVVRDGGESRVLCPFHQKHFLEVST